MRRILHALAPLAVTALVAGCGSSHHVSDAAERRAERLKHAIDSIAKAIEQVPPSRTVVVIGGPTELCPFHYPATKTGHVELELPVSEGRHRKQIERQCPGVRFQFTGRTPGWRIILP